MTEKPKTHFVRVLKADEVQGIVAMFKKEFNAEPAKPGDDFIQIFAPDGDVAFAAMPKDEAKKVYICRFHKEVFDEG